LLKQATFFFKKSQENRGDKTLPVVGREISIISQLPATPASRKGEIKKQLRRSLQLPENQSG
jgi:hypothetical protein